MTFDFNNDPLAHRPAFDSAGRISDPVRFAATRETVLKYHKIGALELVSTSQQGEGTNLTFFPEEKKTPGEWRGCLDARPVNATLKHEHFKMEGLLTVRQLVRRDD